MGKGIKYFYIMFTAYVVGVIGALAVSLFNFNVIIYCFSYIFLFALQAGVLKRTQPHAFKRRAGREGGEAMIFIIAALGVITLIVAALEYSMNGEVLPRWCNFIGYGLILIAHFLAQSTLNAYPPHSKDRYGEEERDVKDGGPYDIIRHPMALVIACIVLSIPLLFCVPFAFIPAGLTVAICLIWVSVKDQWRFLNYNWYYDYTKRVSYRFIPFIW